MRYALILVWAVTLAVGAENDPVEVLKRATQKVVASAMSIPNYTCVETIKRDYFEPAAATLPRACPVLLEQRQHPTLDMALRLQSTDRLRLDVTMANGGEIFSWSGANRFEDAGINHVVRSGPIATGSFGGFLKAVFEVDVKRFNFDGTVTVKNRILMRYSFQVPQSESHYRVSLHSSWVNVAYSGTFYVDPETADVVRMTVATGDVPPATGMCQTTTAMDFLEVQLGGSQFLLPKQTVQRFVYPNVRETENTTVFTNCREFRGESTVSFSADEPVTSEVATSASSKALSLPGGRPFLFELTSSIQTDTAAAGDLFSARLVDAIRDGSGKVLTPKGTVVEGRVMRVQSFSRPPEVVVVLTPEALRIQGGRVAFSAVRDWTREAPEKKRKGETGVEFLLPLQGEENAGLFRFSGKHVVVPTGFRSEWKTVSTGDSAWALR